MIKTRPALPRFFVTNMVVVSIMVTVLISLLNLGGIIHLKWSADLVLVLAGALVYSLSTALISSLASRRRDSI